MPFSVKCTKLMYAGLTFSIPEATFDLDSSSFVVAICGSLPKHHPAPRKQSVIINPVIFLFMTRSTPHHYLTSTFLYFCARIWRIGPGSVSGHRAASCPFKRSEEH